MCTAPTCRSCWAPTSSRRPQRKRIIPVEAQGLKLISMGLLNPGDKPMIWRGPMLHSVMQQFLRSVVWGELDYLISILPPGTGDVQLTLIQTVPVTGAVLVTTPSTVALADVRKAMEMFRQVNVDILGVVENMSTFACPHCGKAWTFRPRRRAANTAIAYGVPLLGEIEIDPQIRIGGDTGKPVASLGEDGAAREHLRWRAPSPRVWRKLPALPAAPQSRSIEAHASFVLRLLQGFDFCKQTIPAQAALSIRRHRNFGQFRAPAAAFWLADHRAPHCAQNFSSK